MKISTIKLAIALLCIVFYAVNSNAQNSRNDSINPKAKNLIEQIEKKYKVSVYFKSEWIQNSPSPNISTNTTCKEILQQIATVNKLEIVQVDENYFFIPRTTTFDYSGMNDNSDLIIVGDPNEFGKTKTATLQGIVKEGATGNPLFGAVIYESETETGATTRENGTFIMDLPVGEHALRISYVGFEDSFQDIRIYSDGEAEFELFSKISRLEEVTITAQRARENIVSTQMSMIQLDSKTIRELPTAFGERDIVRSVTLMPGIQTIGEFGTGFNVRGGSADQNLILLESAPLFNSSHLFGLISVVNPDMLSDVKLLKGGIPANYGERVSSVMDIKMSGNREAEQLSFTGGIGLINSRVLMQTPLFNDKVVVNLGARSTYSDWLLRQLPDEDLVNSNAGFYDITGNIKTNINQNNVVTLFGYYSSNTFGFSEEIQNTYQNSLGSIRWNSFINAAWNSTLTAAWSNYAFQVDEKPNHDAISHLTINSIVNYRSLKWIMENTINERNILNFGFNLIHYNLNPGNQKPLGRQSIITPESIENEMAYELAGYIYDEWSVTEKLTIEAGLRYSHYIQKGPANVIQYAQGVPMSELSAIDTLSYGSSDIISNYGGIEPRISVRFQLGESSSLKASYNRINQYLHLISNTSVMAPTDLWKLSDTYIKPLSSDQIALGYFRNFSENTIETSIELYYKSLQNAVEYKSGAEIIMNKSVETDLLPTKGRNYGAELYFRKNSGRLTGWLSYTFSVSEHQTENDLLSNQINQNNWFPSNYDRPHNFIMNMNYHISKRWRFNATFTYNTGRPVTLPENIFRYDNYQLVHYSDRNKYRLPDYHRLDVSISLAENHKLNQRGKGYWTFSVMNLYGRKNPFSVFYSKEQDTIGTTGGYSLYQMYIIGVPFPTISYNFRF